jgi:ribonuclease HI
MKTQIYTDGSCRNSIGGYAFIIIKPDYELSWSDKAVNTTNNRMELTAVIEALRCLQPYEPCDVYSDSQWVINCAQKLWKRNKNLDLWEEYDSVSKDHTIHFIWVKGHSGNVYNERCDKMAFAEVNV